MTPGIGTKIGREAEIFHVQDGDQTYVVIDAPYTDCGHSSASSYRGGCQCDACMDKHAEAQQRYERAKRIREEAARKGRLFASALWGGD